MKLQLTYDCSRFDLLATIYRIRQSFTVKTGLNGSVTKAILKTFGIDYIIAVCKYQGNMRDN